VLKLFQTVSEKIIYFYQTCTPDLLNFRQHLDLIWQGKSSQPWRTPKTSADYDSLKTQLGQTELKRLIQSKMTGRPVAILQNDFPYDVLIPRSSSLVHLCIWCLNASLLEPEFINQQIRAEFSNTPALVFQHGPKFSTVQGLPHAHIIIDGKNHN